MISNIEIYKKVKEETGFEPNERFCNDVEKIIEEVENGDIRDLIGMYVSVEELNASFAIMSDRHSYDYDNADCLSTNGNGTLSQLFVNYQNREYKITVNGLSGNPIVENVELKN